MIRASRIPVVELAAHERRCGRCGIVWNDFRYQYVDGAPCSDCRSLEALGDIDLDEHLDDESLKEARKLIREREAEIRARYRRPRERVAA